LAHTAQFYDVWRCQKTPPSPLPDNYFKLCLSVNTFCALVWTLFRDKCDYYKGLLKVCNTLDQQEVHIISDSFTANMCCRIMWEILSNGRFFFIIVLVKAQFCGGKRFKWPTSLTHKITDNVCFAKPINLPFYPAKWLATTTNRQGTVGNNGGKKSYGGGKNQGANKEPNKGQQPQGRNNGGERGNCGQPWVDDCHPRIVAMVADYVSTQGLRVQLNKILNASNKHITDLPMILEYANNGRPFVCRVHILGQCRFPNCPFKNRHIPCSSIPNAVAE
jgi:hypothetical protein